MLIQFTVENWMSFRDKTTFSTVATSERQHGKRVCKLNKFQTRILPVAVIFGGNASGKTNFCRALRTAQSLIIFGTTNGSSIPVEPFVLNKENTTFPTKFAFQLWIDNLIFKYSFSVTHKEVSEERLSVVNSKSERTLYVRRGTEIDFDDSLRIDSSLTELLDFIFKSTWDNQLFLTNIGSHKLASEIPDNFKAVHKWFKETLYFITPDIHYEKWSILDENERFNNIINRILSKLDTGISRLALEYLPLINIPISDEDKSTLRDRILSNPNKSAYIKFREIDPLSKWENVEHLVVTYEEGELIAKKMSTYHTDANQREVNIGFPRESHGTQRVIELMPSFIDLASQVLSPEIESKLYIIDEIDRSLHSHMTVQLIQMYLDSCSRDSRNQLIFTTHDNSLINQELFRRDEIWFTERYHTGETTLVSLSDYKGVRHDKDIRKSYMDGRLGGVPRIESTGIFNALLDTD